MGGRVNARKAQPQSGDVVWLNVPGNQDPLSDDEQFLMQATKETWDREYKALAGDGRDNPGEIALCQQMRAEQVKSPIVRAYYEQVQARHDMVVRVGKARNWLQ